MTERFDNICSESTGSDVTYLTSCLNPFSVIITLSCGSHYICEKEITMKIRAQKRFMPWVMAVKAVLCVGMLTQPAVQAEETGAAGESGQPTPSITPLPGNTNYDGTMEGTLL